MLHVAWSTCGYLKIVFGALHYAVLYMCADLPYSWKYWRELNLVVEPKITIARILADLNLAVRYRIAIHIYARGNFDGF